MKKIFMEIEAISLLNNEMRHIDEEIKSKLDAILEAIPEPGSVPQSEPEPKAYHN